MAWFLGYDEKRLSTGKHTKRLLPIWIGDPRSTDEKADQSKENRLESLRIFNKLKTRRRKECKLSLPALVWQTVDVPKS